jgi:hypothetical protein
MHLFRCAVTARRGPLHRPGPKAARHCLPCTLHHSRLTGYFIDVTHYSKVWNHPKESGRGRHTSHVSPAASSVRCACCGGWQQAAASARHWRRQGPCSPRLIFPAAQVITCCQRHTHSEMAPKQLALGLIALFLVAGCAGGLKGNSAGMWVAGPQREAAMSVPTCLGGMPPPDRPSRLAQLAEPSWCRRSDRQGGCAESYQRHHRHGKGAPRQWGAAGWRQAHAPWHGLRVGVSSVPVVVGPGSPSGHRR